MELLYRLSLLAYPLAFRRRYGAAMLELYRVRQNRARRRSGRRGRWVALARAMADSVRNGADERLGRSAIFRGQGPHRPPLPRGTSMFSILFEESRHAVRRLVRAPIFALASILVLAVGIGANTALFSIVSALMLRPMPFAQPERLVDVYQDSDDGEPNSSSFPAYRDMQAHDEIFAGAAAAVTTFFDATLQLPDTSLTVGAEVITANYFEVLGVPLQRGSGLTAEHDLQGGRAAAVLADTTWRNVFAADPAIVGQTIRLSGVPVTVVGVAARGYTGLTPGIHRDLFVSLSAMGPLWGPYVGSTLDRRDDHWFMVKARLADGVTVAQAQSAMDALADRLAREFPHLNEGRDITVYAPGEVRIHPSADAELLPASAALMTIAGLLLLLVCSNVANLFLVRATSRSDEIALRLAMGAPRSRIAAHALSESLLLSFAGAALGVVGAAFVMRVIESGQIPLPFPGAVDLRLDLQVLGFSAALAITAGLLFGGLPALRLTRRSAVSAMRAGERSSSDSKAVRWARNVLVGAQVAVSFVILALAALYSQGLANAAAIDLGIGAEDVAILRTDASHAGYADGEILSLYETFRQRLETVPGIEAVALAGQLPLAGGGSSTLTIDGYRPPSGTDSVEVDRAAVGASYFSALGVPVLHGRAFEAGDVDGGMVVVVSRAMAETFWGRTDVVGERIGFQSSPDTRVPIVGVVEDVKVRDLAEAPRPLFYTSLERGGARSVYFLASAAVDADTLLPTIRTELSTLDAELPILRLTTLEGHVSDTLALPRAGTAALAAFGALGLLLAGIGLYAVVAFAVQRRTRELGIRIALGAGASNVVSMVLREMLLVAGIALAAGWLLARVAAPSLVEGLIGVEGLDTLTVAFTLAVLGGTAALAAWVPARRAARVDPVEALRSD